mgnify:CR=1 FL=1
MMEPALKGLLLAIRQEPGCEELKLVLADWLEDHDQSARADLIRLQCQMTPLSERDADRHELQKKVTPLLDRFSDAWAGEPPESVTNLKFREGMLDFTGSTSCLVNHEEQQSWKAHISTCVKPSIRASWNRSLLLRFTPRRRCSRGCFLFRNFVVLPSVQIIER